MSNSTGIQQSHQFSNESSWLRWRNHGIGASNASTLFDANPFESKLELWKRLRDPNHFHNKASAERVTDSMIKGKELEAALFPLIRQSFDMDIREQVCLEHPDFPYIRATLDGINVEHGYLWEMKFINNYDKYLSLCTIPTAHRIQMQQQLLLAALHCPNKDWQGFYIYSNGMGPTGLEWKMIVELPEPALQEEIVLKAQEFWNNHVITGIPPEAAPIDAIVRTDEECVKRCERLMRLQLAVDEADQLKKELKELGGETPFRCAGVNYSFNTKLSTARYKEICELPCVRNALKEHGLSIENFREPPTVQKRIWFDGPQK